MPLLANKSLLCVLLKSDIYGHDLSLVTPMMIANNIKSIDVTNNQKFKIVGNLDFKGRLVHVRNATELEMSQATKIIRLKN